jgi:hypothetical protein
MRQLDMQDGKLIKSLIEKSFPARPGIQNGKQDARPHYRTVYEKGHCSPQTSPFGHPDAKRKDLFPAI